MKINIKYRHYIILLIFILFIVSLLALSFGRYSMNPMDVFHAIKTKAMGIEGNQTMEDVLFKIRLPRVLSAILIGASLSISGAIYQGVFQNPLVSPDLLGVSSGASVGAAIAILLGINLAGVQGFAFIGGIVAVGFAVSIPKLIKNESNTILVLSGIIVGGFSNSVLGIIKFIADPESELASIVFWQMGSLSGITMDQIKWVMPIMIVSLVLLVKLSWQINIISFGDKDAQSLGVPVKLVRGVSIICASLLTASAVSISGTIGWIGLVIPHLGRLLVGSDHTKLLPVTILHGALFLLIIDTISRLITSLEIPLSILTGLIGAPFYAWLLWKQKAKIES